MPGGHKRNTTGMQESPRCGARTRSGAPCKSPAVRGQARCRMHGGAKDSGAPKGNTNAYRHGLYSAASKARFASMDDEIKAFEPLLKSLK